MNIISALEEGARFQFGSRWMERDGDYWVVLERPYKAKKTLELIRTENEEEACYVLLGRRNA